MAVLGKVQDYTKNVIKSTVFASAEVVGNLMPTVHDFGEENKEIFVTAYSAIKDYRNTFKKIQDAITKSKIYEAVDTAWKNALDDLKTGNFYNKNRENKADEAVFATDNFGGEEGGDGGFGDLDIDMGEDFDKLLSDTDDFGLGDEESDEDADVTEGDVLVAKTVASTGQNVANTIAGTQVKATDAMMKSNRINTNILYTQNEKMMGIQQTGFTSSINALENLTKFNTDVMQKHVDNASKFFTEQSKLDSERNAMMKEMLEMQRNLYKIQMGEEEQKDKKKKIRFGDFVSGSGALDIGTYIENVKQNIGTAIDNSQFSMLKALMNTEEFGQNPLLMFAQSPLATIATGLASMLIGPETQKVMANLDKTIGGITGKIIADFNHMARMEEGGIWSVIGEIFGSRDTVRSSLDPGNYKRGQMPWDGEAKKALVEVIPQYLASIEAALTGRPHRLFDYRTGMFVDSVTLDKSFKDIQDRSMKRATGDFMRGIMEYTDQRQFMRREQSEQLAYFRNLRQLEKAIYSDPHIITDLQSLVGTNALRGEEAEEKKEVIRDLLQFGGYNPDQDLNLILKAMEFMDKGDGEHKNSLKSVFGNVLEARTALNNEMEQMNEDPNAIMRHLFTRGYVEKMNEDGIVTTNKTDLIHRLDLNEMRDAYRANIFDYLRGIQRELVTIRMRGFGLAAPIGGQSNVSYVRDPKTGKRKKVHKEAPPLPTAQESDLAGRGERIQISPEERVKEAKRREAQRYKEQYDAGKAKAAEAAKKKGYKGPLWVDWQDTTDEAKLIEYDIEQSVKMQEQFEKIKKREETEREESRGMFGKMYKEFKETNKAKYQEHWKSIRDKGFLDTLLEAEDITEKWAVFRVGMENLASKPADFLTKHLAEADDHLYRFFFKEEEKVLRNGEKAHGFFGRLRWEMENVFDKMNAGLDKYLLQPLKEKLGVEGPWDAVKKAFSYIGLDVDTIRDQVKESAGGLLTPIKDNIVETFKSQFEETRRELEEIDRLAREKLELEQKKNEEGTSSSSSSTSSSTSSGTVLAPRASSDDELIETHVQEMLNAQTAEIDKMNLSDEEKEAKKKSRESSIRNKYQDDLVFNNSSYDMEHIDDLMHHMFRELNYTEKNGSSEDERARAAMIKDKINAINKLRAECAAETDGNAQKAINDKIKLALMELKGKKGTVEYYRLLNKIIERERVIRERREKEKSSWGTDQRAAYEQSQKDRIEAAKLRDQDLGSLTFDANTATDKKATEGYIAAIERLIKFGDDDQIHDALNSALNNLKTKTDVENVDKQIAELQEIIKADEESMALGIGEREVITSDGSVSYESGDPEGLRMLGQIIGQQKNLLKELQRQKEVFEGLVVSQEQIDAIKKVFSTRYDTQVTDATQAAEKEKADKEEARKKQETTIESVSNDQLVRSFSRNGRTLESYDVELEETKAKQAVQRGYDIFSRKAQNERDVGDHRGFDGLREEEINFVKDFIQERPAQAFDMRYRRDIENFLARQLLIEDEKLRQDIVKSFRRDFITHKDLDRLFDAKNIGDILNQYQTILEDRVSTVTDAKAKKRAEDAKKAFEDSEAISKMEGRTGDIYGDSFRTKEEKKIETGELLTLEEREPAEEIDIGFEALSINENILQAIKDLPSQLVGDASTQTIKDMSNNITNSIGNLRSVIERNETVFNKIEGHLQNIFNALNGTTSSEPPVGTRLGDREISSTRESTTPPAPEGTTGDINVTAQVDMTSTNNKLDLISTNITSLKDQLDPSKGIFTEYRSILIDIRDALKSSNDSNMDIPGFATGTPSFSGGERGLSAITKGELFISPKGQVSEAPATGIYSVEKGTAVVPKAFNPMNNDKDKFDIQSQIAGEMAAKKDFSATMANYFKDVVPGFATGTPGVKSLEIKDEKKYIDDIAKSIFEAVDVNAEGTNSIRLSESSHALHLVIDELKGKAGKLEDKDKARLIRSINNFIKLHPDVAKEHRALSGTEKESEIWSKAREVISMENKNFKEQGYGTVRLGAKEEKFEDFQKRIDAVDKSRRVANTIEAQEYFKDNTVTKNVLQGVNNFKESVTDAFIQLTGFDSKEVKEATKDVGKQVMDGIPNTVGKGLLGGTVGLLLGGPLVGALLGGAVGFVQTNENMKKALFGEKILDKNGDEIGRSGGWISKDVYDVFTKYVPSMKNVGIAGAVAGLITPFGPLGGALIGAGLGALKANDDFQEFMFGSKDKDNGLISKKTQKWFKKSLPNMAAASVAGLFLGPFGLVGNLMVGGATGFMASTETFKEHIFGRLGEDGKRHGGVVNAIRDGILNPWLEFGKKVKNDLFDWVKYDVFGPLKDALAPIGKQVQLAVTGMFKGVSQFLAHWYKTIMGRPIAKWIQEKLLTPISKFGTQLLGTILKPAKWLLSRPSAMIGSLGNMLRRRQIQMGNADYMNVDERQIFRREHGMEFNEKDLRKKLDKGKTLTNAEQWALFDAELSKLRTNRKGTQSAIDAVKLFRDADSGAQEVKAEAVRGLWATIESQIGRGQKEYIWSKADRDKINQLLQDGQTKEAIELFKKNLNTVEVRSADGKVTTGMDTDEQSQAMKFLNDATIRLEHAKSNLDLIRADKSRMSQHFKDTLGIELNEQNMDKVLSMLNTELDQIKHREVQAQAGEVTEGDKLIADALATGFSGIGDIFQAGVEDIKVAMIAASEGATSFEDIIKIKEKQRLFQDAQKKMADEYAMERGMKESELTSVFGDTLGLDDEAWKTLIAGKRYDRIMEMGKKGYPVKNLYQLIMTSDEIFDRIYKLFIDFGAVADKFNDVGNLDSKQFENVLTRIRTLDNDNLDYIGSLDDIKDIDSKVEMADETAFRTKFHIGMDKLSTAEFHRNYGKLIPLLKGDVGSDVVAEELKKLFPTREKIKIDDSFRIVKKMDNRVRFNQDNARSFTDRVGDSVANAASMAGSDTMASINQSLRDFGYDEQTKAAKTTRYDHTPFYTAGKTQEIMDNLRGDMESHTEKMIDSTRYKAASIGFDIVEEFDEKGNPSYILKLENGMQETMTKPEDIEWAKKYLVEKKKIDKNEEWEKPLPDTVELNGKQVQVSRMKKRDETGDWILGYKDEETGEFKKVSREEDARIINNAYELYAANGGRLPKDEKTIPDSVILSESLANGSPKYIIRLADRNIEISDSDNIQKAKDALGIKEPEPVESHALGGIIGAPPTLLDANTFAQSFGPSIESHFDGGLIGDITNQVSTILSTLPIDSAVDNIKDIFSNDSIVRTTIDFIGKQVGFNVNMEDGDESNPIADRIRDTVGGALEGAVDDALSLDTIRDIRDEKKFDKLLDTITDIKDLLRINHYNLTTIIQSGINTLKSSLEDKLDSISIKLSSLSLSGRTGYATGGIVGDDSGSSIIDTAMMEKLEGVQPFFENALESHAHGGVIAEPIKFDARSIESKIESHVDGGLIGDIINQANMMNAALPTQIDPNAIIQLLMQMAGSETYRRIQNYRNPGSAPPPRTSLSDFLPTNEELPKFLFNYIVGNQMADFLGEGLEHLKDNFVPNLQIDLPDDVKEELMSFVLGIVSDQILEKIESLFNREDGIKPKISAEGEKEPIQFLETDFGDKQADIKSAITSEPEKPAAAKAAEGVKEKSDDIEEIQTPFGIQRMKKAQDGSVTVPVSVDDKLIGEKVEAEHKATLEQRDDVHAILEWLMDKKEPEEKKEDEEDWLTKILAALGLLGSTLAGWLSRILTHFKDFFKGFTLPKFFNGIRNFFKNLGDRFSRFIKVLSDRLKNGFESLKTKLGELGRKIKGFFSDAKTGFINAIKSIPERIGNALKGLWKRLEGIAPRITKVIETRAGFLVDSIGSRITGAAKTIVDGISAPFKFIGERLGELPKQIGDVLKGKFNDINDGIGKVKTAINDVSSKITGNLSSFGTGIKTSITEAVQPLVERISKILGLGEDLVTAGRKMPYLPEWAENVIRGTGEHLGALGASAVGVGKGVYDAMSTADSALAERYGMMYKAPAYIAKGIAQSPLYAMEGLAMAGRIAHRAIPFNGESNWAAFKDVMATDANAAIASRGAEIAKIESDIAAKYIGEERLAAESRILNGRKIAEIADNNEKLKLATQIEEEAQKAAKLRAAAENTYLTRAKIIISGEGSKVGKVLSLMTESASSLTNQIGATVYNVLSKIGSLCAEAASIIPGVTPEKLKKPFEGIAKKMTELIASKSLGAAVGKSLLRFAGVVGMAMLAYDLTTSFYSAMTNPGVVLKIANQNEITEAERIIAGVCGAISGAFGGLVDADTIADIVIDYLGDALGLGEETRRKRQETEELLAQFREQTGNANANTIDLMMSDKKRFGYNDDDIVTNIVTGLSKLPALVWDGVASVIRGIPEFIFNKIGDFGGYVFDVGAKIYEISDFWDKLVDRSHSILFGNLTEEELMKINETVVIADDDPLKGIKESMKSFAGQHLFLTAFPGIIVSKAGKLVGGIGEGIGTIISDLGHVGLNMFDGIMDGDLDKYFNGFTTFGKRWDDGHPLSAIVRLAFNTIGTVTLPLALASWGVHKVAGLFSDDEPVFDYALLDPMEGFADKGELGNVITAKPKDVRGNDIYNLSTMQNVIFNLAKVPYGMLAAYNWVGGKIRHVTEAMIEFTGGGDVNLSWYGKYKGFPGQDFWTHSEVKSNAFIPNAIEGVYKVFTGIAKAIEAVGSSIGDIFKQITGGISSIIDDFKKKKDELVNRVKSWFNLTDEQNKNFSTKPAAAQAQVPQTVKPAPLTGTKVEHERFVEEHREIVLKYAHEHGISDGEAADLIMAEYKKGGLPAVDRLMQRSTVTGMRESADDTFKTTADSNLNDEQKRLRWRAKKMEEFEKMQRPDLERKLEDIKSEQKTFKENTPTRRAFVEKNPNLVRYWREQAVGKTYLTDDDIIANAYEDYLKRTEDALRESINRTGKGSGRFAIRTAAGMAANRPLANYSQIDNPISNMRFNMPGDTIRQTVADSSCGPNALDSAITNTTGRAVDQIGSIERSLKYKEKDGGTKFEFFKDEAKRHGLTSTHTTSTSVIDKKVGEGNQIVIMSRNKNLNKANDDGVSGPGHHYSTISGQTKDGKNYIVSNPEKRAGQLQVVPKDKLKSHISDGFIIEDKRKGRGSGRGNFIEDSIMSKLNEAFKKSDTYAKLKDMGVDSSFANIGNLMSGTTTTNTTNTTVNNYNTTNAPVTTTNAPVTTTTNNNTTVHQAAHIPQYKQFDEKWQNGKWSDLQNSGCAPTSTAIQAEAITGKTHTPVDVGNWAIDNGYRNDKPGLIKEYAKASGYEVKVIDHGTMSTSKPAYEAMKNGLPVVIGLDKGALGGLGGSYGHYLVGQAINDDNKVLINNPGRNNEAGNEGFEAKHSWNELISTQPDFYVPTIPKKETGSGTDREVEFGKGDYLSSDSETVQRRDYIWNWLRDPNKGGLNEIGAAGVMGNIHAESSFDPKLVEGGGHANEVTETNMSGAPGYGLFQTTYYALKEELANYAKSKGKSSGDIDTQLEYVKESTTVGSESGSKVWEKIQAAPTPEEAATIFMKEYERPGVPHEDVRRGAAQEVYSTYTGKPLTPSKTPPSSGTYPSTGATDAGTSVSGSTGNFLLDAFNALFNGSQGGSEQPAAMQPQQLGTVPDYSSDVDTPETSDDGSQTNAPAPSGSSGYSAKYVNTGHFLDDYATYMTDFADERYNKTVPTVFWRTILRSEQGITNQEDTSYNNNPGGMDYADYMATEFGASPKNIIDNGGDAHRIATFDTIEHGLQAEVDYFANDKTHDWAKQELELVKQGKYEDAFRLHVKHYVGTGSRYEDEGYSSVLPEELARGVNIRTGDDQRTKTGQGSGREEPIPEEYMVQPDIETVNLDSKYGRNTMRVESQSGPTCTIHATKNILRAYTGQEPNFDANDKNYFGRWYSMMLNDLNSDVLEFSRYQRNEFEGAIKQHFDSKPNNPILLYETGGAGASISNPVVTNRVSGNHATVIGRRLSNGKYEDYDSNGGNIWELGLNEIFDETAEGNSNNGTDANSANMLIIPRTNPTAPIDRWEGKRNGVPSVGKPGEVEGDNPGDSSGTYSDGTSLSSDGMPMSTPTMSAGALNGGPVSTGSSAPSFDFITGKLMPIMNKWAKKIYGPALEKMGLSTDIFGTGITATAAASASVPSSVNSGSEQVSGSAPSATGDLSYVVGEGYDGGSPMGPVVDKLSIHHTGTNKAGTDWSAADCNRLHVEDNHWDCIGYHFVIRKNGTIERGRKEKYQGAHTYGHNERSLGIHVSGDFNHEEPTQEQIKSLMRLMGDLCKKYNIPCDRDHIRGHYEWDTPLNDQTAHRSCPGLNLGNKLDSIVQKVAGSLSGGTTGQGSGRFALENMLGEKIDSNVVNIGRDPIEIEREVYKEDTDFGRGPIGKEFINMDRGEDKEAPIIPSKPVVKNIPEYDGPTKEVIQKTDTDEVKETKFKNQAKWIKQNPKAVLNVDLPQFEDIPQYNGPSTNIIDPVTDSTETQVKNLIEQEKTVAHDMGKGSGRTVPMKRKPSKKILRSFGGSSDRDDFEFHVEKAKYGGFAPLATILFRAVWPRIMQWVARRYGPILAQRIKIWVEQNLPRLETAYKVYNRIDTIFDIVDYVEFIKEKIQELFKEDKEEPETGQGSGRASYEYPEIVTDEMRESAKQRIYAKRGIIYEPKIQITEDSGFEDIYADEMHRVDERIARLEADVRNNAADFMRTIEEKNRDIDRLEDRLDDSKANENAAIEAVRDAKKEIADIAERQSMVEESLRDEYGNYTNYNGIEDNIIDPSKDTLDIIELKKQAQKRWIDEYIDDSTHAQSEQDKLKDEIEELKEELKEEKEERKEDSLEVQTAAQQTVEEAQSDLEKAKEKDKEKEEEKEQAKKDKEDEEKNKKLEDKLDKALDEKSDKTTSPVDSMTQLGEEIRKQIEASATGETTPKPDETSTERLDRERRETMARVNNVDDTSFKKAAATLKAFEKHNQEIAEQIENGTLEGEEFAPVEIYHDDTLDAIEKAREKLNNPDAEEEHDEETTDAEKKQDEVKESIEAAKEAEPKVVEESKDEEKSEDEKIQQVKEQPKKAKKKATTNAEKKQDEVKESIEAAKEAEPEVEEKTKIDEVEEETTQETTTDAEKKQDEVKESVDKAKETESEDIDLDTITTQTQARPVNVSTPEKDEENKSKGIAAIFKKIGLAIPSSSENTNKEQTPKTLSDILGKTGIPVSENNEPTKLLPMNINAGGWLGKMGIPIPGQSDSDGEQHSDIASMLGINMGTAQETELGNIFDKVLHGKPLEQQHANQIGGIVGQALGNVFSPRKRELSKDDSENYVDFKGDEELRINPEDSDKVKKKKLKAQKKWIEANVDKDKQTRDEATPAKANFGTTLGGILGDVTSKAAAGEKVTLGGTLGGLGIPGLDENGKFDKNNLLTNIGLGGLVGGLNGNGSTKLNPGQLIGGLGIPGVDESGKFSAGKFIGGVLSGQSPTGILGNLFGKKKKKKKDADEEKEQETTETIVEETDVTKTEEETKESIEDAVEKDIPVETPTTETKVDDHEILISQLEDGKNKDEEVKTSTNKDKPVQEQEPVKASKKIREELTDGEPVPATPEPVQPVAPKPGQQPIPMSSTTITATSGTDTTTGETIPPPNGDVSLQILQVLQTIARNSEIIAQSLSALTGIGQGQSGNQITNNNNVNFNSSSTFVSSTTNRSQQIPGVNEGASNSTQALAMKLAGMLGGMDVPR